EDHVGENGGRRRREFLCAWAARRDAAHAVDGARRRAAGEKSVKNANGFATLVVTGGAGYVGSALVPSLLAQGYRVRVVDTFWYGRDVFGDANRHPALERHELDIRESARLRPILQGVDAVIHLACISNDPSFELDPTLGKSINYDAFAG